MSHFRTMTQDRAADATPSKAVEFYAEMLGVTLGTYAGRPTVLIEGQVYNKQTKGYALVCDYATFCAAVVRGDHPDFKPVPTFKLRDE